MGVEGNQGDVVKEFWLIIILIMIWLVLMLGVGVGSTYTMTHQDKVFNKLGEKNE